MFPRRHSSESCQRSRSPSPCGGSLSPRKNKKRFFKFEKTSSLSSQEDLSSYHDLDLSDTNEGDQNFLKMAHSARGIYFTCFGWLISFKCMYCINIYSLEISYKYKCVCEFICKILLTNISYILLNLINFLKLAFQQLFYF